MLTDKSKEDRLRRWTLKRFLVIFGQNLICESILVLVSLWLLINSFKETSKEKTSDWFFLFNRGYSVNDRLDFILKVIKWDYNTNDRLKFILSFIRWENGLNKR